MRQNRSGPNWSFLLGLCLLAGCSTPTLPSPHPEAIPDGQDAQRQEFRPSTESSDPLFRRVPPSSPAFRYEGRLDTRDAAGPVLIWQASRVRIDFEGPRLALRLDGLNGQSFFDARVDGAKSLVGIRDTGVKRLVFQPALGPGRHSLELFKRSEAAAGWVRFEGIEVDAAGSVQPPATNPYPLRMEFFGDSITVGACDEDGRADQWKDRSTHDNAKSYGALTAAAFSADYRNFAVSGMGVVTGYVKVRASQVWDRYYPEASSPRAEGDDWRPDVLFVNLGENDDSYSKVHHRPFPPTFAEEYVSLVRDMRRAYPRAWIVLLRGGMYGGARSRPLKDGWSAAVATLEASDPAIRHFEFQHWSSLHPRLADHRVLARELVAWLKGQDFMRRYAEHP